MGETKAAAATTNALDEALVDQKLHDLDEVILGDVIGAAHLRNGDEPIGMRREIEQEAQRVVGEEREAHGRWR